MASTVTKLLTGKSIAVVTHYYGTGPGEALHEFLPSRVSNFFWLGYPLFGGKPVILQTKLTGKKGQLDEQRWGWLPEPLLYVSEVVHTVRRVIATGAIFDLYIGIDSLNALAGIVLKRLGRVKKVAFYTIDFVSQRFRNPLLNALYHRIDRFCVEHADITWNLSRRMVEGREKVSGFPKRLRKKQIELPIGVWWQRIKPVPFSKVNKNHTIFVGHLTEKQGLQLMIEAIPLISHQLPQFHLDIIGDGPYRKTLEQLVAQKGLRKAVTFHGFIKSDATVERLVAKSALTLALYRKEKDPFSYYADPGKLKVYLAAGVPVVLTDVPAVARAIARAKAGVLTEYDARSVANAITKLLKNPRQLARYRAKARAFAKQFDWPVIFEKAFRSVM